jgi:hypothetical protein
MAHQRREARFVLEPPRLRPLADGIGLRDLDHPDLVQVHVPRAENLAHPALGELAQDLVLAVEDVAGGQARRGEAAGGTEAGLGGQRGVTSRASGVAGAIRLILAAAPRVRIAPCPQRGSS